MAWNVQGRGDANVMARESSMKRQESFTSYSSPESREFLKDDSWVDITRSRFTA